MMPRIIVGLLAALAAFGAEPLKPKVAPPDPAFNRLYPNERIVEFLKGYAAAYPEFVRLASIGKASGGGEMWLVTIHNPTTGAEPGKPAIYIDAATHANEIQGTEVCLYLINYVLKNYGKLERVTELLDRAVLYVVPMSNPDSRVKWFTEPSTPNFPRTPPIKIDDDRDGLVDEDGYEDLNGDGEITMMRKKVPLGQGRFRLDPKDPRLLVPVQGEELGDYIQLGLEGIDNDGDGQVNEDPIGYIDANRTWAWGWQPRYVQGGSSDYPLQYPETRTIAEWFLEHPNVAAAQSFHNTGRIILRGPGARGMRQYPPGDVRAYDLIAKEGEKLLPGYKYGIIWKDLYSAYGGSVDHFYGVHGAIALTNELNGPQQDFDKDGRVTPQETIKFSDLLTHGRMFVNWKPYKHPQYGDIEIGGYRHDTERPPEGFLLEEECHRNAAFVLFHAHHLPRLSLQEPVVTRVRDNVWKLQAAVLNDRAIPSMSDIARQLKLHRPDIATVEGAKVLASGLVRDPWMNRI
ncbi:MAG: peptidase M14, partial [Acidobacteria bacterium]|nr:peptidase M14 [Acidobacteriota bacterium]